MDIDALLKSIVAPPQNTSDINNTAHKIEKMTLECSSKCDGSAAATSAIVLCMLGATMPLVRALFSGNVSAQDRLLFSLVLAGAVTSIEEKRNGFDSTVEITPDSVRDAIDTYRKLTGKDISRHLPPQLVRFANGLPQDRKETH